MNEAKATILDLQAEIKLHKSEIDILRQKNQKLIEQIGLFNGTDSNAKRPSTPPPIPLEPVIIVKESKADPNFDSKQIVNIEKHKQDKANTENGKSDREISLNINRSSESENTYVM